MRAGQPQTNSTALAIIVQLMTRGEPADRADLCVGIAPGQDEAAAAAVLAQLEAAGYVAADGDGRLELSDRGWCWLGQEIGERPDDELLEDLDVEERVAACVLYALLNLVHAYLETKDLSLAEFVVAAQRGRLT